MACRTPRPKRELVRIVRTPSGTAVIDESGRLAGRGAYLCRDANCIRTGIERGLIARALDTPLPPELRGQLEAGSLEPLLENEGGARGQE